MCYLVGKAQYSESRHLDFISISTTKFLNYLRQIILWSSFLVVKIRKKTGLFNRCLLSNCINTHAVLQLLHGAAVTVIGFSVTPGAH